MVTANCDVGSGISLYFIAGKRLSELLAERAELSAESHGTIMLKKKEKKEFSFK